MKYMLLLYHNQTAESQASPEEAKAVFEEWAKVMKEMNAAGVLISNNGFAPVTNATNVKVRGGKTVIADGPFAETHEQLGGFFLIDCQDLDEAIQWAAKIPSARTGTIEIRPLWDQVL